MTRLEVTQRQPVGLQTDSERFLQFNSQVTFSRAALDHS